MSLAKDGREKLKKAVELNPANPTSLKHLSEFYLGAPGIVGGSVEKSRELAQTLMGIDEIEGRLLLLAIYQNEKQENQIEPAFEYLAREDR